MPDLNTPDGPNGIFILPPADTSSIRRKYLDLAYGSDSPFQKIDVYLPNEGEGPFPTVISVHGGAWRMGDKSDRALEPALTGLARGWAVVSVNYRLSQHARFPGPVDDAVAALRWVHSQGPAWGLDPGRLVVWGESAGAHLAAHAALREPTLVRAAALWYCPTNFSLMDHYLGESGYPVPDHALARSPESLLLGAAVDTVPELVRLADPQTWITPGAPPVYLQHGTADDVVPWQFARDFAERLTAAVGRDKVRLDYLEGAGHATDEFRTPGNVARVWDWFGSWVGATRP
jgi:acetyl esterase/lipase